MARFGRDMMIYATADLLGSSIGLVLSPIFTRLFTPAQYGAQAALAAVWGFVALAQYGGMDSAYPNFRARTTDESLRRRLLVTASFVAVASALLVSGLFGVVGLVTNWMTDFAGVSRHEMFAYGLTLAPAAVMAWFLYVLRFERQAMAFARVSLLGRFAGGLLLVPTLMLVAQPERLSAGFLITAIVSALAALLGWRELRGAGWSPLERANFDRNEASAMLRFGLALVPGYSIYAITTVLDRVLVTWFSGQAETAVLALALRLGGVALMLRTWFALGWDPQLVEWIARLPRAELIARLNKANDMIAGVAALLVCGAALWTEPVVTLLYPREYWATISLVPWSVLGVGAATLALVAVATTTIAQTPRLHLPVYLVGLVVNLGVSCWWIPKLGAAGAILGGVCTELSVLVSWIFLGRVYLRNLPLPWWRPLALLGAGGLFVALYRAGIFFPSAPNIERALVSLGLLVVFGLPLARRWREFRKGAT